MALTLKNFENVIDPEILERGWQYFKSGHVRDLELESEGVWTALVKGTVNYDVVIEQEEEGELACECTCPYDWGPYCKHVAAVLYAIREKYGEVVESTAKPGKSPKQKSQDKVRSILESLSHEDLVDLITQQFEKDRAFADWVLVQYSGETPHKSVYARRVRESLKAGRGEYGYIDYWSAHAAVSGVNEMLEEADALIATGKAHKSIPMLQAIIEGLVAVVEEADDSNGAISGAIEEAFICTGRAAEALPAGEKATLFSYCLSEAFENRYQHWDWKWSWLEIAGKLAANEQRQEVFQALDRMAEKRAGDHFSGAYNKEAAAHIKLSIIEEQDGPEAAYKFLLQHQSIESFRQRLVQHYIHQGNLAEAKKVCEDALWQLEVHANCHLYRGIYEQYLLAIAEQEGDKDTVIRMSREQFITSSDFRHYDRLKQFVGAAEWPQFVQELIQAVNLTRQRWGGRPYHLPEIYAREEMWDKLLELVKQDSGGLLEQYRQPLEERYPSEACALYEKAIYRDSAATGRGVYQQICQYLRRMKRLGQSERAEQIISELREKYPKRRAMIEELAKVE